MNRSRRKPTSCSTVPGSSLSRSTHCETLLPFPLSFSSLLFLSSSFFFFFLLSFSFLSFLSLFLSCSPLLLQTSPFIHACICMYFDPWLTMCHPTLVASKNVKFRLSRNSKKFIQATKFHKTNPTVRSVSSSEIYKTSMFSTCTVATIYCFVKNFEVIMVFTFSPTKKNYALEITYIYIQVLCICNSHFIIK